MGEEPPRELQDIDTRIFKNSKSIIALFLFLIYIVLMYLTYLDPINRPDPSIGGLSKAFAYSLIVWIYGMIAVIYAALEGWR